MQVRTKARAIRTGFKTKVFNRFTVSELLHGIIQFDVFNDYFYTKYLNTIFFKKLKIVKSFTPIVCDLSYTSDMNPWIV